MFQIHHTVQGKVFSTDRIEKICTRPKYRSSAGVRTTTSIYDRLLKSPDVLSFMRGYLPEYLRVR
jgi:hypothetical protein